MKLWKNKNCQFIFTSHISRRWELKFLGRAVHTYNFKGLRKSELTMIIQKRLHLVGIEEQNKILDQIPFLFEKHGDNIRGIMLELYEFLESKHLKPF